jgi:organic radical activating enzyme
MAIEVETNGTVTLHPALDPLVHQVNVSPKLAHSGNPADLALPGERLAAWADDPRAQFKFVVADDADVAEALALVERHAIPRSRVWLMAEGRDPATLDARGRWLAETCSKNELNFSPRLHIHLWGDTRGT